MTECLRRMALKRVGTELGAVWEAAVGKEGESYRNPLYIEGFTFVSSDRDVIQSTPYYTMFNLIATDG